MARACLEAKGPLPVEPGYLKSCLRRKATLCHAVLASLAGEMNDPFCLAPTCGAGRRGLCVREWGWAMAGNRLPDRAGFFCVRLRLARAAVGVLMAPGFLHMSIEMGDSRSASLAFSFVPEFGWMRRAMARRAMVPHVRSGIMLGENYAWSAYVDGVSRASLAVFDLLDSLGIYGRLCWGFAW